MEMVRGRSGHIEPRHPRHKLLYRLDYNAKYLPITRPDVL